LDLKLVAEIRRRGRRATGGELDCGAMAGIGLSSAEFVARAIPDTSGHGTSAKRKRRSLRTHQDCSRQRKSDRDGVRLSKADGELLYMTVRQSEPTEAKIEGKEDSATSK
jgi:hypothetical protein